jgi:hypothetical protein
MKAARLAGLIFVLVLAGSLMAATVASASAPEFNPGTLNLFHATTGLFLWETASTSPIDCQSSETTGEITGVKRVGSVMLLFSGCTSSKEGISCPVSSFEGAPTGKILFSPLDGELGSVKTSQAASGVGLVLLPTSGTTFVTLNGTCLLLSPSPLDGAVAGEVRPVGGASSKDGSLVFGGRDGAQSIKEINVLGAVLKPKLLSLGLLESSWNAIELIT